MKEFRGKGGVFVFVWICVWKGLVIKVLCFYVVGEC